MDFGVFASLPVYAHKETERGSLREGPRCNQKQGLAVTGIPCFSMSWRVRFHGCHNVRTELVRPEAINQEYEMAQVGSEDDPSEIPDGVCWHQRPGLNAWDDFARLLHPLAQSQVTLIQHRT